MQFYFASDCEVDVGTFNNSICPLDKGGADAVLVTTLDLTTSYDDFIYTVTIDDSYIKKEHLDKSFILTVLRRVINKGVEGYLSSTICKETECFSVDDKERVLEYTANICDFLDIDEIAADIENTGLGLQVTINNICRAFEMHTITVDFSSVEGIDRVYKYYIRDNYLHGVGSVSIYIPDLIDWIDYYLHELYLKGFVNCAYSESIGEIYICLVEM